MGVRCGVSAKYHPYKAIRIPTSQFTAEGGYYYTFLSDANKVFLLSLGGSALAGYETNNWGEKLLYDGSTLRSGDNFVYGGAVSLELESYLSNRVVLLLNARERACGEVIRVSFIFSSVWGLNS